MNHWFDSLTKNLASNGLTRRTFLDGVVSGLALAALDFRFDQVLAAQLPGSATLAKARFAPSVHLPMPQIQAKSLAFGPCTVMIKGSHYERHFKSETQAAGHTITLKRTHISNKRQWARLETRLEIDGKPQLISSVIGTGKSKKYRLRIGEAFGFTALLTSDDGKTVQGKIDGRAIVPLTESSKGELKFEDGKPFKARPQPYLEEAIKTASARAHEDLKLCAAPTHALNNGPSETRVADSHHRAGAATKQADPPPCNDCDNYANMSYQPTNAVFTPGCQACINKCNDALNSCLNSNGLAALASFGLDVHADYMLAIGCNSNDLGCTTACYTAQCLGQLCPGEKQSLQAEIAAGATLMAPLPSCDRDQVCVNSAGFCCPRLFPTACPGWYDPIMAGNTIASNICCQVGYSCLWDTSSGYFGCCPKARTCVTSAGGYRNAAYSTQGMCCALGEICDGHGSCCPPFQISGGRCCGGYDPQTKHFRMWCGGRCIICDKGSCVNGKCEYICLGGYTTEGKCCTQGNACGKKCCPYGCADFKTSTCVTTPPSIPPPK